MNYTLWEVPVFVRGGFMLPTAPAPGAPNSRFGDSTGPDGLGFAQPAIGGAARTPEVLSWEIFGIGATAVGSGTVWEDANGFTNVSYAVFSPGSAAGDVVHIRISGGPAARTHRFELQNVPPAVSVAS